MAARLGGGARWPGPVGRGRRRLAEKAPGGKGQGEGEGPGNGEGVIAEFVLSRRDFDFFFFFFFLFSFLLSFSPAYMNIENKSKFSRNKLETCLTCFLIES